MTTTRRSDAVSVVAVAVLAMVTVTVNHELIGHGAACLAVGGRPTLVSTSLFACSVPDAWVAPAGPVWSALVGLAALLLRRRLSAERRPALWLYLTLVTGFSWFWEGGYAVQSMIQGHGDLYDTLHYTLGPPGVLLRVLVGLAGAALYFTAITVTSRALTELAQPRWVARVSWAAATAAAVLAPLASPLGVGNRINTLMAFGLAGLPLLVMPPGDHDGLGVLRRSWVLLVLAVVLFVAFTATLGLGLR